MTVTDVEKSLPRPIGLRIRHGQRARMVKHGHDPNSTIVKPGATTAVPPHSGLQLRAQCGHGPHENLASKLAHCFPGNASWDDAALISHGDAPVYVSEASKTTGNNDQFDQYVAIPFHLHQSYGLAKWLRIWEDMILRACNGCNSMQMMLISTAVSICLDVDLHPTVKWETNRQPFYTVYFPPFMQSRASAGTACCRPKCASMRLHADGAYQHCCKHLSGRGLASNSEMEDESSTILHCTFPIMQ